MLAIIGGTGLYQLPGLNVIDKIKIDTPFGQPSAPIVKAECLGHTLLFLPRHGEQHQLMPHEINYRANIFALKQLGARQLLGVSATGSLRESIHPGAFILPTQYLDLIRGNRDKTFFGQGVVAHVSTAMPVCPNLTAWVAAQAKQQGMTLHQDKVYACVDGPRLGTKAESHFLRMVGCDVVGMTNVPEVFLAREAQLCYATLCIATDYDCWQDDPAQHVTVAEVIARYGQSLEQAKALLTALLATPLPPIDETYRRALDQAILTPDSAITNTQRRWLNVLMQ
ncbi:S-methyl-5'-thioadenosine phosphorylase [Ostreibacterium oceani]|uniref:Purine nucleoside phosphorylase n=1 Tax=Ostreibacterium oceani TaxID=2654998 RepID=A0A6N7ESG5_9GAMM|nr:S-methyl-5'-thioadenosine phosphorylase [Ostreibacterium oceani]MPV85784.1 S-methyl-5'-thioadenosine phosphorylase [Ostreibacterium oceani]